MLNLNSAMVQWPKPKTPKAMRGFPGLMCYSRKFTQDYGKIAVPAEEKFI